MMKKIFSCLAASLLIMAAVSCSSDKKEATELPEMDTIAVESATAETEVDSNAVTADETTSETAEDTCTE